MVGSNFKIDRTSNSHNVTFLSISFTNKIQDLPGGMGMGGSSMNGSGGRRRGGPEPRPGDWECPRCYNLNFATRLKKYIHFFISILVFVNGRRKLKVVFLVKKRR